MTFSKKWYQSSHSVAKRPQGVFGGKILSQAQIKKLNARIRAQEAQEFAKFEEVFDNHLNEL